MGQCPVEQEVRVRGKIDSDKPTDSGESVNDSSTVSGDQLDIDTWEPVTSFKFPIPNMRKKLKIAFTEILKEEVKKFKDFISSVENNKL